MDGCMHGDSSYMYASTVSLNFKQRGNIKHTCLLHVGSFTGEHLHAKKSELSKYGLRRYLVGKKITWKLLGLLVLFSTDSTVHCVLRVRNKSIYINYGKEQRLLK